MIRNGIGHFQVYQKGFSEYGDDKPFDYLITNGKSILRKIYSVPGVSFVAPRLKFKGLLASSDSSAITMGYGGWSEEEKKLNSFSTLKNGQFLSDDDPYGVVIGSGLAKKLDAHVGEYLTLMTTMKGGGMNASDVKVRGIVTLQIKEYNDTFMMAPLNLIQNLEGIPNEMDRLVVMLNRTQDTPLWKQKLQNLVSNTGLEFKEWKDLTPFYFQVKSMYDSMFGILLIIILGVVIFAIANTMTMNVYDRIREIGTIRAIGTKRKMVLKQFMTESAMIGIIGGLIGIVLGMIVANIVNLSGGLYIPSPPGNAKGYNALIKPDFLKILEYWGLFVLISIAASILPAHKATRMSIVDALRWT